MHETALQVKAAFHREISAVTLPMEVAPI